MLRFIFIVLILSSLFRRPVRWGFPFLGGWGFGRPMGMGRMRMHRCPPMGGFHGGFHGGPHGMGRGPWGRF